MLEDLGEVDMGDPAQLQGFLAWAAANYPAQHYALDLWDHGAGFRSRSRPSAGLTRGFSYDDTQGTHILTTALPAAIATVPPLDVLLWDSSLMQMVEVAHQVGSAATFMVGSEASPPGEGYRYDTFLQDLVTTPTLSPEVFSTLVVNETLTTLGGAYDLTQSAVRLSAVPNLVQELHFFAGALTGARSEYATQLDAARTQAQRYGSGAYTYRDYKDLQDYAEKIKTGIPLQSVQGRADAVIQALHAAIVAEGHAGASVSRSHGLSLYVPPLIDYVALYDTLAFAHDTGWDEFLKEQTQPLTVTAPNGGESWNCGFLRELQWQASGDVGQTVRIELLKGGVLHQVLAEAADNTGRFEWPIATDELLGGDFRVRVVPGASPRLLDESDSDFSLATVGPDRDGDGAPDSADCNPDDPRVSPYAAEICGDGIDNNCNAVPDEGQCLAPADFGDAPDPRWNLPGAYPTRLRNHGAYHTLGGPVLGAVVQSDSDGYPSPSADADYGDDGVTVGTLLPGDANARATITVSNAAGVLNAWIDINHDGDWDDPGEQIFTNRSLTAAVHDLTFAIPPQALPGYTYARFRLNSAGGLTPRGPADDGEVEDYRFYLGDEVVVTAPNGGEVWRRATTAQITWTASALVGSLVKLELYKGETLDSTIAASTENDGAFDWAIPAEQQLGTNYRVKVASVANDALQDQSDADFELAAAPSADLSLTKQVDNNRPAVGGNVVFTIAVANAGPDAATGAVVKDQLPQGLTFVSATQSQGAYEETTGLWTLGSLDSGASAALTVTAAVAVSAAVVNVSQVQAVNEADPDSTPANDAPGEDDQDSAAVNACAGWQLPIHLSAGQTTDDLIAGMSDCATGGYDANLDFPHAPNPPEPYVAGYFYHEWGVPEGNRFRTDIRQLRTLTGSATEVWVSGCDFRVEVSQNNTEVALTFDLAEVPGGYPVYLHRCADNTSTDLRAINGQYTFNSGADQLHRFELVVGQHTEQHSYAAAGWTMTSVPLEPGDPAPGTVFGSDFNPLVFYGWGCTSYAWLPEVHFGSGYWLLVPQVNATAAVTGPPGPSELALTCGPGWQMLGCVTQSGDVTLSDCTLRRAADTKTWAEAVTGGWIADLAYGWNDATHGYVTHAPASQCVMKAWKAYWVLPLVDGLTLLAPSRAAPPKARVPAPPTEDGWSLQVEASSASGSDTIEAQVRSTATPGFDGYTLDLPKAPPAPGGLTVEFAHPEWQASGAAPLSRLQTDTRAPVGSTPTCWDFQVRANRPNTGLDVVLTTPDLSALPNHLTATLLDLDSGKTQYLRTTRSYQFTLISETPRQFQLIVEPRSTSVLRLTAITVVPTRGGLTVQYVLNRPATVQAQIRSAAGRLVGAMVAGRSGRAGSNTLTWSARAPGEALPRGVYLVELTARTEGGQAVRGIGTVSLR
ncbi:MAG: hypothetical protein AUJ96_07975 [Armatimonadetes bacterium CG2_30_66_41]|nr:MAG: hypothetical protein AUJ96_07975 [Armatimonadetes bacterium CG2_30_66_41]